MAPQAHPGTKELLLWNWLEVCANPAVLATFLMAQADSALPDVRVMSPWLMVTPI